jgi:hypothetical protein
MTDGSTVTGMSRFSRTAASQPGARYQPPENPSYVRRVIPIRLFLGRPLRDEAAQSVFQHHAVEIHQEADPAATYTNGPSCRLFRQLGPLVCAPGWLAAAREK